MTGLFPDNHFYHITTFFCFFVEKKRRKPNSGLRLKIPSILFFTIFIINHLMVASRSRTEAHSLNDNQSSYDRHLMGSL